MHVHEIRQKFIDYFIRNGHTALPSSGLIPDNDPTLLFTNAGMNQFKDIFTGKAKPTHKRVVTVQKCVRAGGKHNDLENVGHTARHHTFFEMLGNFSFGDYFKEGAIRLAWDFLTVELKIPTERLYVTIHHSDNEAFDIWHKQIGISADRIFRKDKDNFWEMGEFGPCGPCSEIFYDHGPQYTKAGFVVGADQDILDDDQRYVEIWNLVFMQFEKSPSGTSNLPHPCIDTGAGLERLAAALQGRYWNYDTDCFSPLIQELERLSGKSAQDPDAVTKMRVVADHMRSATMLISDGVTPSNEGRGYVLRRIIRRAIRHLHELGIREITLPKLVSTVFSILGDVYHQNRQNQAMVEKFLEVEESKFIETLDQGLRFLNETLPSSTSNQLFDGKMAFKLYDTYGFPLDLTETILLEKGISVNKQEFEAAMNAQKEMSRQSWKGNNYAGTEQLYHEINERHPKSEFLGYQQTALEATLLATYSQGDEQILVFDRTPFYAESGGQMSDHGTICALGSKQPLATITNVQKPLKNVILHFTNATTHFTPGQRYQLQVDRCRRTQMMRNHTATHLLQKALTMVLGPHVKQAGSQVTEQRLRFDFTHFEKPTPEQMEQVETIVNQAIDHAYPVVPQELPRSEAEKSGAIALFGEKYEDVVRVVQVAQFSSEFCGGTHVSNTREIESFLILSEGALSSGVRRIEALTGPNAFHYLKRRHRLLQGLESYLSTNGDELLPQIIKLGHELRELDKQKSMLEEKIQQIESQNLFNNPEQLGSTALFLSAVVESSMDLKKLSDLFIDKYPQQGIVLLMQARADKMSILLKSAKSLSKIDCSKALKSALLEVGGSGGGKKEMAQGSAKLLDQTAVQNMINMIKTSLMKDLS